MTGSATMMERLEAAAAVFWFMSPLYLIGIIAWLWDRFSDR